ncbi:hypothetical protein MC7420_2479 [Coleofasciculus chthonoplastes PCC 7420]|uniref:Uncharacterized protein n=1 Tax=Coleofasciculus chthonoplastes PCC 7420 TaxID=118168 RepID=B4VZQ4_9CYAN|nr:hypothetical protein MC7420_2479 [Coleofasciculus chthonoplastes PCC 7420]
MRSPWIKAYTVRGHNWTDASFRSSASLRTALSMTYFTVNGYEGIRGRDWIE